MKIIFVGIHNKPGKQPLDSSTRTGKIIDEFILVIGGQCVKSNLFDQETFPEISKDLSRQMGHVADWAKRVDYKCGDLIVCLGELVYVIFRYWRGHEVPAEQRPNIIHISHPAAPKNKASERIYISQSILKISTACQ